MEPEFATEDIKNVFSKIMQFMDNDSSGSEIEEVPKPQKLHKLPQAPQKTQSKRKDPSPKANKSSKKISVEEFNNTTYARMQAKQQNLEEKIKRTAKAIETKITKELKPKPEINKESKKITQKPISERYEGIIKDKQKKMSEMFEKLQSERIKEAEKELTFKPNIKKSSESSTVDFSNILERMKEWEDKKNLKIVMSKDEAEEKMKEVFTFKPTICENSSKLMEGHGMQKDVALRLFEHKKPEVSEEVYSFTPALNGKSLKMTRTRSEVKVFDRLFDKHKEEINNETDKKD